MSNKVNPMTVYSAYMSIKLHFESGSYDAFKYNFKGPRQKSSNFAKSRDRYTYEKIAKQYPQFDDLIGFLVANNLAGHTWIRDMSHEVYLQWTAKLQRMTYQFNTDMNVLYDFVHNQNLTFDECLYLNKQTKQVPILELLRAKRVEVESVITLDVLTGFMSSINIKTVSDPLGLLSETVYKMNQYKPFILSRINKAAAKNTIINLFT